MMSQDFVCRNIMCIDTLQTVSGVTLRKWLRAILCWYELTTVLPLVCGFMFGKDGEILKELKRAVVVDGR